MQLISERMGVFDMLDIVRENSWKAGIEQKERRLEKVDEKSPIISPQLTWKGQATSSNQLSHTSHI